MTMRNEIKGLIEAIMNSELSGVEGAVNLACDKVDEIFNNLEELVSSLESTLGDDDNTTEIVESVKEDLQALYDDL